MNQIGLKPYRETAGHNSVELSGGSRLARSMGRAQTFVDASDLLGPPNGEVGLGASIIDVNSDGLIDIYRRNALYFQNSVGSFENVFDALGYEPQSGGGFGAIFGDYG